MRTGYEQRRATHVQTVTKTEKYAIFYCRFFQATIPTRSPGGTLSDASSLLSQALGAWTVYIEHNGNYSFAAFCKKLFPELGVIEVRGPGGDRDIAHEVTPREVEALLAMRERHGMMIPAHTGKITLEIGGVPIPYLVIIVNTDEPGKLAAATLVPDRPDAHT